MHVRYLIPAAALALAGSALAQEQPAAEPAQPPAATQPAVLNEDDRELLKARLQRRLDEHRTMTERVERALKMLDEGQPTERVREEAFPFRRGDPDRRDGQRPDGPRPEGRDAPRPDQPADREAMLRFLDRHNPELAQRLRSAVQEHPGMVDRTLQRFEPHFREIMGERDDEMRELRIENLRIGWDLMSAGREFGQAFRADASSEETKQARERIRAILGRHFDLQVQLHQREIHLLETRLARLRSEIQEQSADREGYIQNKLSQIEGMARRYGERRGPDGSPESKDKDRPPSRRQ